MLNRIEVLTVTSYAYILNTSYAYILNTKEIKLLNYQTANQLTIWKQKKTVSVDTEQDLNLTLFRNSPLRAWPRLSDNAGRTRTSWDELLTSGQHVNSNIC